MDEPKKYREIAADLQNKIDSGELEAGERLPSDAELVELYGASRNTVREAIRFLRTRGVLHLRPGGGNYVPRKIDPFLTVVTAETGFGGFEGAAYQSDVISKNRKPTVTTPRVELQQPSHEIADELHLDPGSTVVIRHQERSIDGELWSMQTSYYSMDFVSRGATRLLEVKDIPEGIRSYLATTLQIREIGSRDTMTVRAPSPGEAVAFGLPDDGSVAVFETRQTGVDDVGEPVRVTITIYPSDRNRFYMDTRNLPPKGTDQPLGSPGLAPGDAAQKKRTK